jgi:deoxyribonuclease IV
VRIGAHIRTRGGVRSVVPLATAIGAEAVQFFASNPRAWAPPRPDDRLAAEFRESCAAHGVAPAFLHAPYLVNIASPNPEFRRKSVDLSRASMEAADALGAVGLVVHAGAGGPGQPAAALERAAQALDDIAAEAGGALLVLELMAGGAGSVASTFAEAAALFGSVERGDRLRLCLDTCHLFAAGYPLDEPDGVRRCFAEMRRAGLARKLVLLHANDARFPRGSRRDRHESVGRGCIGRAGFAAILADPAVRRCAVVCETPGDQEAHRRDVALLRELAA